ncbi:MAG: flagellin [Candidatus Azotimanducaceae bacterium]
MSSASTASLGENQIIGDVIAETTSTGINSNATDADDDIVISAKGAATTIDVVKSDSAQSVASKINAVTATTGVTADVKTQAHLFVEKTASETHDVLINGIATGSFTMSSTDVSGAVSAINDITAQTGVVASATTDNKVLLTSSVGADIVVENNTAQTELTIKALNFNGTGQSTQYVHAQYNVTGTELATGASQIVNNTTGDTYDFVVGTEDVAALQTALTDGTGLSAGKGALRQSSSDLSALAVGDYYIKHAATSDVFKISVATDATDIENWMAALASATYAEGDRIGQTFALNTGNTNTLTENRGLVEVFQGKDTNAKLGLRSDALFGDFEIYSDSTLETNIMASSGTNYVVGSEAKGVRVKETDEAYYATGELVAGHSGSATGAADAANQLFAAAGTFTAGDKGAPTLGTFAGGAKVAVSVESDGASSITGVGFTVTGTDVDGNTIVETVAGLTAAQAIGATGAAGAEIINVTRMDFATVTNFTVDTAITDATAGTTLDIEIIYLDKGDTFEFKGGREFGDFEIQQAGTALTEASTGVTGNTDSNNTVLGATDATGDTATVQGSIKLSSVDAFNVTQSGTEVAYPSNDNYFTTSASSVSSVAAISIATTDGASSALSVLDTAIDSVSTIRASLGAIDNRLGYTVSNLMNVAEATSAARAQLEDADYSVESANLAKAQVLLQAGTAMLAQANAAPQMVLQLLQ